MRMTSKCIRIAFSRFPSNERMNALHMERCNDISPSIRSRDNGLAENQARKLTWLDSLL